MVLPSRVHLVQGLLFTHDAVAVRLAASVRNDALIFLRQVHPAEMTTGPREYLNRRGCRKGEGERKCEVGKFSELTGLEVGWVHPERRSAWILVPSRGRAGTHDSVGGELLTSYFTFTSRGPKGRIRTAEL